MDKGGFSTGYDGISRRNFLAVIGAAGATLADYERVTPYRHRRGVAGEARVTRAIRKSHQQTIAR
jgi:hypothetical protein